MERPRVDLNPLIMYLREKAGLETYAKQLENIQDYLKVTPTTGDKIDIEELLSHSILVNARRMLETIYPREGKAQPFIVLVELAKQEILGKRDEIDYELIQKKNEENEELYWWRILGKRYGMTWQDERDRVSSS